MVVLKLFGAVYLEGDAGVLSGAAVQRHRLALLALLATARSYTLPREKLMELLWPERDGEQARNLLKQSVYVLRKALGDDAISAVGDALRLDTELVQCDVIRFEQAVRSGDHQRAIELYTGPFLDGFFLGAAQEFEDWVSGQRLRLADAYESALEALAEEAETRGELRAATEYWKSLAAQRPLDTGTMLRLMRSLELSGDPAGAVLHAELHERQLKDELGMRLPAEMVDAVARLQGLRADGTQRTQVRPASVPPESFTQTQTAPLPQPQASRGESVQRWLRFAPVIAVVLVAAILAYRFEFRAGDSRAALQPATDSDDIAKVVAQEVERRLRGEPGMDHPARRTANIAAYEAYLRGNDPAMNRSPATAARALDYFRQAVALDPSYAAAWAGVAKLSMRVAHDDSEKAAELIALSEKAALKAIELDDSLAEAHAVVGMLRMSAFDLPAAEVSMQRALALDPGRGQTREWLVSLHLWMRKTEQALAEARRAAQLDPLSPSATAELARALAANGRCDDALARLDLIADVDPPLLRVPLIVAQCRAQKEQWQSAIDALAGASPAAAEDINQAMLGYVLARSGQREDAIRILDALHDQWRNGDGGAFPVAMLHGGLGNRDQVFTWLERSIEDRSLAATPDQFTMLQPILEQLEGDPRFERLPMLAPWSEAREL